METSRLQRIILIAGTASLFVSYLGIWGRFISNPVERTGSDFIAFYSAGRVAQAEGFPRVYDASLQQDVQEAQVGFPLAPGQVLLYNHMPFLIPILRALVGPNYVGSFYRWLFLLITLYIGGIFVLSMVLKSRAFDPRTRLLAGTGGLLFLPLFFSLMNGQDTAFVFLGAAIWVWELLSGRETLAGLGLSLMTVRPHIALVLALPMLFSHRKAFLGFVLGSGVLALLSIAILGSQGTRQFIDTLLLSAGGEWYGMKEAAMYNLLGLLARTSPRLGMSTIRLTGWIVYGIGVLLLCVLWARGRRLQDGRIGLTVTVALFIVPHLHFHDLALLLIPIHELIRLSTPAGKLKTSVAVMLPVMISLLLLAGNAAPFLQYTLPYLLMLALAGCPYFLKLGNQADLSAPRRS